MKDKIKLILSALIVFIILISVYIYGYNLGAKADMESNRDIYIQGWEDGWKSCQFQKTSKGYETKPDDFRG